MAVKTVIESPASSSEEESSSQEDHQLKKGKLEYESEKTGEDDSEEESDESEDTDPKPKSIGKNPTVKAQENDDGGSEESDSEEEESDELEDSDPKSNSVSKIPTENVQEGDDDGSEESDSEEEESEKKSYDMKPVCNDNKENKTDVGNSKKEFFQRLWSLEDEKVLLNSMLQFRLEKGKEVDSSSLEFFCDFLKGRLSFTDKPKCTQVSLKIKALKKKYSSGTCFTNEHDLKMKEIASQVWEVDVENKSLKRKFSMLEEEVGKMKIVSLKKKLEFGDNVEKAKALEEKIRKRKILEMKQELKRMDLMRETFKHVLDGFQK